MKIKSYFTSCFMFIRKIQITLNVCFYFLLPHLYDMVCHKTLVVSKGSAEPQRCCRDSIFMLFYINSHLLTWLSLFYSQKKNTSICCTAFPWKVQKVHLIKFTKHMIKKVELFSHWIDLKIYFEDIYKFQLSRWVPRCQKSHLVGSGSWWMKVITKYNYYHTIMLHLGHKINGENPFLLYQRLLLLQKHCSFN